MKTVKIIACCDINGVIAIDNKIPWNYPLDLQRFKQLTMGSTVIMGRKTYESLPKSGLPGRKIHVVTRQSDYKVKNDIKIFTSLVKSIEASDTPTVWIAGGAEIYNQAMFFKFATEIDLTVIDGMSFNQNNLAYTYFPPIPLHYECKNILFNPVEPKLMHRNYVLKPNWMVGWAWESPSSN